MKKTIFCLLLSITVLSINAQTQTADTVQKEYNNIISIDATSLLLQFINHNEYTPLWYSPYILSYKRILGNNALRIGIGGSSYQSSISEDDDTLKSAYSYYNIRLGLGYEHHVTLSKRWMMYFGADIIGSYSSQLQRIEYTPTYDVRKYSENSYGIGISPLLGFSFTLNKRLSIGTEACYDVVCQFTKTISQYSLYPNADRTDIRNDFFMSFHAPTAINFRVRL